jgi:hypothetical protein
MSQGTSTAKELAKGTELVIGHVLGVIAGLVLMLAGAAMGVSLVLLPVGIPVGLVGLGLFLWGLFGWASEKRTAA